MTLPFSRKMLISGFIKKLVKTKLFQDESLASSEKPYHKGQWR